MEFNVKYLCSAENDLKDKVSEFKEKQLEGVVSWKTYKKFLLCSGSKTRIFSVLTLSVFLQVLVCLVDVIIGSWYAYSVCMDKIHNKC